MSDSHPQTLHTPQSPLVVQVGFAGSRLLYEAAQHPALDEAAFHRDVEEHLGKVLERLPKELGLVESHFLCGISSAAIGADSRFINACAKRGIPQRIFLPEHREAFMAAPEYGERAGAGKGDFAEAQKAEAHRLLASPHIIEERVISNSNKREQRFEDVNLEIVRVSSVLIALSRESAQGKRGGTRDLIERAKARKKLVLEITVSVQDGRAVFSEQWHPCAPEPAAPGVVAAHVPGVPEVVADFAHKGQAGYVMALQDFTGARAQENQSHFKTGAQVIIRTHVIATILATALLAFHPHSAWVYVAFLAAEGALLVRGFRRHSFLHKAGVVERWATCRLLSEVARSVAAMSGVRRYLQHLFVLPLPQTIRHMLRTLNFLHLKETCRLSSDNWVARRGAYVHDRLVGKDGQIKYYAFQRDKAKAELGRAQRAFQTGSGCAMAIVAIEIAVALLGFDSIPVLGFATVILPVLAVAALSLAASLDLEARVHSYGEMVEALEVLAGHLNSANSEGEFHTLAIQTEARLVGENAAWYSRRVFIRVT